MHDLDLDVCPSPSPIFPPTEIPVEFTAQLSEQHVEEHKIACFKCDVNKEDVTVMWEKENLPIEPSNKHIIQQEGTSHTLVIKDCDKDDVAEYSVVVGDQKSSARLRLDGKFLCIVYVFQP